MIRRFLKDARGNFAMLTAIAMVPIMGALTLAIDYSEMSRRRQLMINALDAAGIATARQLLGGADDAALKTYAKDFFEANLSHAINPADTTLTVLLPQNNTGGGTLKLCSNLQYHPYFLPVFYMLLQKNMEEISFDACTDVQLQNTLEVALVLDNSGSMNYTGKGSGKKRLELLKIAAKQLVETLAARASMMKQISKPVQFALVPFSGSVNVGTQHAGAWWMDTKGLSSIHYENFDLPAIFPTSDKRIDYVDGVVKTVGTGWGTRQNESVTRFTLFDELKVYTTGGQTKAYTSWQGCVEARPGSYNLDDATPTVSEPDTLFVPMFAPDEYNNIKSGSWTFTSPLNNWWEDSSSVSDTNASIRQRDLTKYFTPAPSGTPLPGFNNYEGYKGPNYSCTTKAITPLTDISTSAGLSAIKNAINSMISLGATNVPEGLAWGWRTLSHGAPFTDGRPETERGNDKAVIVLTDGENTYYSLKEWDITDRAATVSYYSAYGYTGQQTPNYLLTRIFQNTSEVSTSLNTNDNYTAAMNEHFDTLCDNAKWKDEAKKVPNIIVMTVALDLNANDREQEKQIEALKKCSSDSRFRKDADGNPKKLFWNTTGGDLEETFKDIADELSNLRIVG